MYIPLCNHKHSQLRFCRTPTQPTWRFSSAAIKSDILKGWIYFVPGFVASFIWWSVPNDNVLQHAVCMTLCYLLCTNFKLQIPSQASTSNTFSDCIILSWMTFRTRYGEQSGLRQSESESDGDFETSFKSLGPDIKGSVTDTLSELASEDDVFQLMLLIR